MKNEDQNILKETIEKYHREINGLYVVMNFTEKQILITKKRDIIDDFLTTINIIKYNSFLIASYIDLLTSFKGIINSETKWDIIFYSKNGFLSIYETIKTYNSHQKNIRGLITSNHPNLLLGYIELNKKLKIFKKDYNYETKISPFRNRAAGHYDENYVQYYEQIQSLDIETSKKAIAEFANFLKSMMEFVETIIDELKETTKKKADKSKAELELLQKTNRNFQ